MHSINDMLADMRKAGKFSNMQEKGDLGEDAVLDNDTSGKSPV